MVFYIRSVPTTTGLSDNPKEGVMDFHTLLRELDGKVDSGVPLSKLRRGFLNLQALATTNDEHAAVYYLKGLAAFHKQRWNDVNEELKTALGWTPSAFSSGRIQYVLAVTALCENNDDGRIGRARIYAQAAEVSLRQMPGTDVHRDAVKLHDLIKSWENKNPTHLEVLVGVISRVGRILPTSRGV